MDYLDPKKKQQHRRRILLGYGLFAIAIGFATLLLVFIAKGYDIDRDTGEVIQNGLVYIDSRPGGAEVYLNGVRQRGSTDARLVIPGGSYDIELRREGYRTWNRSLLLEGGSLRRLTYARLIPETLETAPAVSLRANPIAMSQSINRRWLVASFNSDPLNMTVVDTESASSATSTLEIPETLVARDGGKVEIVEWASDNRHFLATYTVGKDVDYLLIDREQPTESVNISDELNDVNDLFDIQLRDRQRDSYFVYDREREILYTATLDDGIAAPALQTDVISYKTFGEDWLLYVTDSDTEGLQEARFKRGDDDILLKEIKTSEEHLLQLARLGDAPIMGVGSDEEDRIIVYNDPQNYLRENETASIPVATTVLRVVDPVDVRISTDSSVILAYGPENFASHEFEADRSYNFTVDIPVDKGQELRWLDGQHFLFSSDGVQMMMDFDGSNLYDLVPSVQALGSFYSNDLTQMYSITRGVKATDDDPAVPARLQLTQLLTAADR